MPLSGPGAPEVAEDAVMTLGAALGVSYRAALRLVGEAVELCSRLPRLWALVQVGCLQAWEARQVARHTMDLTPAAAGYLDRHLAVTARRNQIPRELGAMVHEALVRCDPDIAEGREEAAVRQREVTFAYTRTTATCATATLTATLDMLDALDLDATLSEMALSMGRLRNTSPLGVRRAHALGMLAHPRHTLNVFGACADTSTVTDNGSNATRDPEKGWNAAQTILYLHLTTGDYAWTSPMSLHLNTAPRYAGLRPSRSSSIHQGSDQDEQQQAQDDPDAYRPTRHRHLRPDQPVQARRDLGQRASRGLPRRPSRSRCDAG